jgi:hypothetical protein
MVTAHVFIYHVLASPRRRRVMGAILRSPRASSLRGTDWRDRSVSDSELTYQ